MANKNGYIVSRSNYTLKKKNQKIFGGDIYERDFMTTTNLGGWDDGVIPYGESNFKMRTSTDRSVFERKHEYGKWITKDDSTVWNGLLLSNKNGLTTEGHIKLKPNYETLLDFAYFGSCKDLVQSSVIDIIKNFPAELYFSTDEAYYEEEDGTISVIAEGAHVVENPLGIDIISEFVPKELINEYNPLRFFCESANKYEVLDVNGDIVGCVNSWSVIPEENACFVNGDKMSTITIKANKYDQSNNNHETTIVIEEYYRNGESVYVVGGESSGEMESGAEISNFDGFRIRPFKEHIEEYFLNIDDFEGLLLNRRSNPIFSCTLDYPEETDLGIVFGKRTFTWPTLHNWNLDIESSEYSGYISELLKISEIYDNNFSDNLWRMLTHESIKNMDTTIFNVPKDDSDIYEEGTSIIESVIKTYGRQFDNIKRMAANIKTNNVITYNGHNNIPDYFLSDALELSGWEVTSINLTLDSSEKTQPLFEGESEGYSADDMSVAFMRNLKINSKQILSKKGTRAGIESILGLFGFVSKDFDPENYDYEISEYVVVAQNTSGGVVSADEDLPVETYNAMKSSIDYDTNGEPVGTTGLPVRIVTFITPEAEEKKYMIPWFSNLETYDGNMYFQMYGGWGKVASKSINEDIAKTVSTIYSDDKFTIFDETLKYLRVVERSQQILNVSENDAFAGDIFYANDISDYTGATEYSSHYFILKDKDHRYDFTDSGWTNIPLADIENGTNDGIRVLYLESLIDQYKGNNPHTGYGHYDGGDTFFEYFDQIFKYSIEHDEFRDEAYDCNDGTLLTGITSLGFDGITTTEGKINYIKDNVKCWYFTDKYNVEKASILSGNTDGSWSISPETDFVDVGKSAYEGGRTFFDSEMVPFNLETQDETEYTDVAAANSIINSKRLKILFRTTIEYIDEFKKYIYNCVYPYLVQMIPSTALLEIEVEGNNTEYACLEMPVVAGFVEAEEHDINVPANLGIYTKFNGRIKRIASGESPSGMTPPTTYVDENVRKIIFETEQNMIGVEGEDVSKDNDRSIIATWEEDTGTIRVKTASKSFKLPTGTNESYFRCFSGLTEIIGLDLIDASGCESFSYMFAGCASLVSADLSSWRNSRINPSITQAGFHSMFSGCTSLETVSLSNINSSGATHMNYMFAGCSSIEEIDLSNFDTRTVRTMPSIFNRCRSLSKLYLNGPLCSTASLSKNTRASLPNFFYEYYDNVEIYFGDNFSLNKEHFDSGVTYSFLPQPGLITGKLKVYSSAKVATEILQQVRLGTNDTLDERAAECVRRGKLRFYSPEGVEYSFFEDSDLTISVAPENVTYESFVGIADTDCECDDSEPEEIEDPIGEGGL